MRFPVHRRAFLKAVLAAAAGAAVVPLRLRAQGAAPSIVPTVITDRVVMLSGDGGNVGLVLGDDGVLMIDGGLANRASDLAAAVARVDARPVVSLFNTHYHFDHVGSNELLGGRTSPARPRIIAHQNVAARLGQRMANEAFQRTFEPLAPEGLPTDTFTRGGTLSLGSQTAEYTHVPLAHTDGDAYVFLAEANVLQTGDLLWIGRYPVVDYSAGGTLAGMISALDRLVNVGDDATRVIPGHGPLVGKAEMRATRQTWSTINARIDAMVRDGRTLEQVMAAQPTREFDATLGTATRDSFIRQVYGGLRARQPQ